MNALTTLLVAVVLVAGGILVYDALQGEDGASPGDAGGALREGDTTRLGDAAAERLAERIAGLERQIEAQGREIADLRTGSSAPTAPGRGGGRTGAGEMGRPAETAAPESFDEATLRNLQAHMMELRRRQQLQGMRDQAARGLERLGLDLTDAVRNQLIEAAAVHRQKLPAFRADLQARGITAREEQIVEYERFRQAFVDQIRPLLPADVLDRAVIMLIGPNAANAGAGGGTAPVTGPR
ncbi:MAG: hypothetical protein ACYTG6_02475 [Planctomycetota bacterium]|jgi:hypothetical protein